MESDKKSIVTRYLQEQIAQSAYRARAYVFDDRNKRNPTRNCYVKLREHVDNYLGRDSSVRWIILSGFRGVGKTTLLSQIFFNTPISSDRKLYLSVDHITQLLGVTLDFVLSVYEEVIGIALERLEEPVFLFLDEVQYDKNWAITLKSIFDRSNKVFIFATGSSALSLNHNPDVARRAVFEKLYPMSFTEFQKIKNEKFEIIGLSKKIRQALYHSASATEVHASLKKLEPLVRKYWAGIERLEIDRYLKYGTLPFAAKQKNESIVYEQIKKIIDRVIGMDIVEIGQFRSDVLQKIPEVLYSLASSDGLSVTNLSRDIGLNKVTLTEVLFTIEKTETITRIYPYGAHVSQIKKPSKYLFSSPAFRSMYFHFMGNILGETSYIGKLLEDTVGLYLIRYFSRTMNSLTYDSSKNSADFIAKIGKENISIEVGIGEKGFSQVSNSIKERSSKYGLVFSMTPLKLSENKDSVSVPLSYFLLS